MNPQPAQTELAFFNTIAIAGEALQQADEKALSQEDKVLQLFTANPGKCFTPFEVYTLLIGTGAIQPGTPITSIRRAITNLTTACKLMKADEKKPGQFNTINLTWKLAA